MPQVTTPVARFTHHDHVDGATITDWVRVSPRDRQPDPPNLADIDTTVFTFLEQSVDDMDQNPWERGYQTPVAELWAVHNQTATRVGYLKMTMHRADIDTVISDVFDWLDENTGWCLNRNDPRRMWQQLALYSRRTPPSVPAGTSFRRLGERDVPDGDILTSDLNWWKTTLEEEYADRIASWRTTGAVPRVWYSWVVDSWQRHGFGTAMYLYTAERLHQRWQRPLVSSTLQSDAAQHVWAGFVDHPWYTTVDVAGTTRAALQPCG